MYDKQNRKKQLIHKQMHKTIISRTTVTEY